MDFKEINIEDKKIMDVYLKKSKYKNCEYAFVDLFIWKHLYTVKYTIHKNMLILASFKNNKSPRFIMPIGDGNLQEVIEDMMLFCKKNDFTFKMVGLSDEMIEELEAFMPSNFEVLKNDLYDYVYLSEDLIELKGKKYSSKRNHIKQFNSNYDYEYVDITEENTHLCEAMLTKWCESANCEEESLKQELIAVRSALSNIKSLELVGGGLIVDGGLIAFTLGQPINCDTFNINIEKAFYEYKGAYAKINNEFAANNLSSYKYINREDDAGVLGLRKAKLSYYPALLVYKHDAILREG
jgi:uncharacterized protein